MTSLKKKIGYNVQEDWVLKYPFPLGPMLMKKNRSNFNFQNLKKYNVVYEDHYYHWEEIQDKFEIFWL